MVLLILFTNNETLEGCAAAPSRSLQSAAPQLVTDKHFSAIIFFLLLRISAYLNMGNLNMGYNPLDADTLP